MIEDTYPLISIIIPAYNSALTIRRAVESVLAQTYPDIEVLVIDDGSSDDTAAIVRKMAADDSRVRLIRKRNHGVSAARNDGIRSAAGEWFVTLDADDYIAPEMINSLYDAARRDDADTVICGFRKVYSDGRREVFRSDIEYSESLSVFTDTMLAGLYDRHLISTHSNKLYRMSLVRERHIYYNEELAVNEDLDFVLRYLAECGTIGVIRPAYLYYVQHGAGESLINTFRSYGMASSVTVLNSCRRLLEKADACERTCRAMDRRMFNHICSFAGLMYRYSGYSGERELAELYVLCSQEDFSYLLDDLVPAGPKETIARFLLKSGRLRTYHRLCRLMYNGKLKGTLPDAVSMAQGADAAMLEAAEKRLIYQSMLPYKRLGLFAADGGENADPLMASGAEPGVTRADMKRLREILGEKNGQIS